MWYKQVTTEHGTFILYDYMEAGKPDQFPVGTLRISAEDRNDFDAIFNPQGKYIMGIIPENVDLLQMYEDIVGDVLTTDVTFGIASRNRRANEKYLVALKDHNAAILALKRTKEVVSEARKGMLALGMADVVETVERNIQRMMQNGDDTKDY